MTGTTEPERPRKSVREMADEVASKISELEAEKAGATTRRERSDLNKRLHMLRDLEKWYRTRRGYE